MSIDRYTPCPGGTGKKIKFCCHDLLNELDGLHRMLEGEQRLACLEHVEKLRGLYPGTRIFFLNYGYVASKMREMFEAGTLDDIITLVASEGRRGRLGESARSGGGGGLLARLRNRRAQSACEESRSARAW